MTERKKISLSKPTQATSRADDHRKPPVRGQAPRKRMTAAEAAQAREEAAQRATQRAPREERTRQRDEQAPYGARRDARDGSGTRQGAPRREGQGHLERRAAPPEFGDRRHAGDRSARPDRQDRAERPYRDERSPRFDERRPSFGRDERPSFGEPRQASGRPARRDDRRADGRAYPASRFDDRPTYRDQPRRPDGQNERAAAQTPAPDDGRIRLSKLMSERGLSSRREADEWIEHGWVRVNGEVVSELGSRVAPDVEITIDPLARTQQAERMTILLHKPIGYVSGQAEDGYDPAVVLITAENRWADDRLPVKFTRGHLKHLAPCGRLDIDSTGLLVLSQDGRIAKHLIGEDSGVEKEYLVRVQYMPQPDAENVSAVVPAEAIERLRHGLELDGRPLRPAQVSWQNEHQLRFVLREGRKRQIRRMCELVGLKVVGLKRVRMGSVVLGKLPLGQWRFLRPDERF